MRYRPFRSLVSTLLILSTPQVLWAQDGIALRDEVKESLRLNLGAIESIEAEYTYSFEGYDSRCRMAQDGKKAYSASVLSGRSSGLLSAESAWDGSQSYMRTRFGLMSVSRDQSRYKASSALPHEVAAGRVLNALGLAPISGHYEFVEARAGKSEDEVVLVHRHRREGSVLTTVHSLEMNGWPTSVEVIDALGQPTYRSTEIGYEAVDADGNTIWYPVLVRARQAPKFFLTGEQPPEVTELSADVNLRVDLATLRINHEIDDARFVLTAWPSEDVLDETTQRTKPAADPSWKPAGNVDFPFDEVAMHIASAEERAEALGAAEAVGRASPGADSGVLVLADTIDRGGPVRWWHLVLGMGLLLVGGAAAIALSQRRRMIRASAAPMSGERRGFTLVELMVVIGIIAILLSLMMPVLASARRKAMLAHCATTMRSAGQAVILHANDNRGRLYPTYSEFAPLGPRGSRLAQLYADGDYRPELLLCGTADEREWISYLFNGWTSFDKVKLHDVGQDRVDSSATVLLGESVPWSNYELSDHGAVPPVHRFFIKYDDKRHAEHGANRLWLDLHVSRDLPRGTPDHPDPWYVPQGN